MGNIASREFLKLEESGLDDLPHQYQDHVCLPEYALQNPQENQLREKVQLSLDEDSPLLQTLSVLQKLLC